MFRWGQCDIWVIDGASGGGDHLRRVPHARQNACVGIRYVVLADTEQECAAGFVELCTMMRATAVQAPAQLAGARWIARAVPDTEAPAEDGRGSVLQAQAAVDQLAP